MHITIFLAKVEMGVNFHSKTPKQSNSIPNMSINYFGPLKRNITFAWDALDTVKPYKKATGLHAFLNEHV